MKSYEEWFKGKHELDILRILGLFDRPAEGGAIKALRARPPISGLTSELQKLSVKKWLYALKRLRKAGLLVNEDSEPDKLDCHPLIREYFGEKLKENNPEAWKEGHSILYEYYKDQVKEFPDTVEEMIPLYAAVAHGCQAGRYQEAYREVFRKRIQRNEAFSWKKLGTFGADLAALSGLFDETWSRPVAELEENDKGFILNEAGLDLRALGWLAEAAEPLQVSLKIRIAQEKWEQAAIVASNLSELHLTMGDLARALEYAEKSVDLGDRNGDPFERMSDRTTLADALHQAGRLPEAEATFQEAEEIQKEYQLWYPLLYSLRGFQYCDLLLGQGKYQEVQNRAEQTLEWEEGRLLDIGLDNFSLGKAYLLQLLQEGTDDFTLAEKHLNQAMNGLRQAGHQEFITRGLLARAEMYRVQGSFDKAQRDLDEAMTIAKRGEMGLHQADCHLEYTRLYLAMGDKDKAQEHLPTAREMIEKMGYHRRDGEVEELEA